MAGAGSLALGTAGPAAAETVGKALVIGGEWKVINTSGVVTGTTTESIASL